MCKSVAIEYHKVITHSRVGTSLVGFRHLTHKVASLSSAQESVSACRGLKRRPELSVRFFLNLAELHIFWVLTDLALEGLGLHWIFPVLDASEVAL